MKYRLTCTLLFILFQSLSTSAKAEPNDISISLGAGATNGVLSTQVNWYVTENAYAAISSPVYAVMAGHAGFLGVIPTVELGYEAGGDNWRLYMEAGYLTSLERDRLELFPSIEMGLHWQWGEHGFLRFGGGNYLYWPSAALSAGYRF